MKCWGGCTVRYIPERKKSSSRTESISAVKTNRDGCGDPNSSTHILNTIENNAKYTNVMEIKTDEHA